LELVVELAGKTRDADGFNRRGHINSWLLGVCLVNWIG
jgi:hypothetical protein